MTTWQHDWQDIWYTCVIEDSHSHVYGFRLYKIMSTEDQRVPGSRVSWQRAGEDCSPVFCDDLDKAWCICRGGIKWDGCCNFELDGDGAMLHFCGLDSFSDFHEAIKRTYESVAGRMEAADRSLMDLE